MSQFTLADLKSDKHSFEREENTGSVRAEISPTQKMISLVGEEQEWLGDVERRVANIVGVRRIKQTWDPSHR